MLIKLPNNKLNNKITFRRSKRSYDKHEFSSIIPIRSASLGASNNFISKNSRTLGKTTSFGYLSGKTGIFGNSRRAYLTSSLSFLALFFLIFAIYNAPINNVSAASVSITVTGNSSQSIDLLPTATTRDFKKSGNVQVTVSTTDASAGYTLTLADKNNDNQRLTGTNSSNYLTSISSATTESTFNANLTTASSTYDNKWGIFPSKLNGETNTNYQPGPKKTTPTTIDITNTTGSQTYTFAIGARVDSSQAKDNYTGTFTLAASANPVPYSIGYVDLLSNMPTTTAGSTTESTVTLSNTTPSRFGYTFKGWCSKPTTNNTCSGTIYREDGTENEAYSLSDGAITNLYAIWEPVSFGTLFEAFGYSKLNGYYKMQDMNSVICSNMVTGSQEQLIDIRDNNVYWVAKQADGRCWMTQNLDLALTTDKTLTNADTDLNSKTEWTPPNTPATISYSDETTTVTGYMGSDYNPHSVEGGDVYYWTSGTEDNDTAQTLAECANDHRHDIRGLLL